MRSEHAFKYPERMDKHAQVAVMVDRIEAEMRAIGLWQNEALEPSRYAFNQAFAMDTMTFSQWLQFVFIPRVREIINAHGSFPAQSMVAAQAVREYDGLHEASKLLKLLSAFDAFIEKV
jgi:uncharacterized protein YqcC (DUF446 family)